MSKKYNWGIIGTGNIADTFAKGLQFLPDAVCYGVASRGLEKAQQFATTNGFQKAYGSYDELMNDSKVDILYIATPNHLHYELTTKAIECGKSVLCEKPFALNVAQVKEMITKAKEKNVFLMEALWSRFLPTIETIKQKMEEGVIGRPLFLKAEFGIHPPYNPSSRLFDPALGGGSVYDIGIYPLFLALYLLGEPKELTVTSVPAPTGVDMTTVFVMKHKREEISVLSSSFAFALKSDATLVGDKGSLRLDRMFHMPTKLYHSVEDGEEKEIELTLAGNGYNYEAAEAMRCMEQGWIESPKFPHSFSLMLMEYIERILQLSQKS